MKEGERHEDKGGGWRKRTEKDIKKNRKEKKRKTPKRKYDN